MPARNLCISLWHELGIGSGDWNEVLHMIETELPEAIIVRKTR